jgi:thiol:disulfide interchange protein DsbD
MINWPGALNIRPLGGSLFTLPSTDKGISALYPALSRSLYPFLALLLLLPAVAGAFSFGSASDGPLPVEEVFKLRSELGPPGEITLEWEIQPDYYLYRDKIEIGLPEQLQLVDRREPEGEMKEDPLFGAVEVYHNRARVDLLLGHRPGESDTGTISVTYQGCWEGGVCYPPVTERLQLSNLPPAPGLAWAEPAGPDGTAGAAGAEQPFVSEQDRFASLLFAGNWLWMVGAFFLAGLALSFTPCVLPMIPILSGIIAGQGDRVSTPRAFMLSLVYVLAMALTYTLAGVLTGLFGANLQASLQQPWIIVAFSAVFVLLALSMFGFYELQLPSALQTRLSSVSHRQRGGTLLGVAVMGLLSALIVGPCMAAPLAGALIYIGHSGDPFLGGSALFALSLGMGVPLLLVGASAGRLLPRAGSWMEGVRAGFGVILLLLAVWMLDRILATEITMLLTGLILLVSAVYLRALDRLPERSGGWQRFWKGVGLVLLLYGAALLIGVLAGNQSLLYPLRGVVAAGGQTQAGAKLPFTTIKTESELDGILRQAQANGEPVLLDFYADWCISCIELEYVTFADPAVRRALIPFRLVKLDLTAHDDAARALYERFSINGPPALMFYDASGQLRPELTLIGVIEPEAFVAQTRRVKF